MAAGVDKQRYELNLWMWPHPVMAAGVKLMQGYKTSIQAVARGQ